MRGKGYNFQRGETREYDDGLTKERFTIDVHERFDSRISVAGDQNLRDLILSWLTSEPNGYAINTPGDGGIDIRTVGPTRRSAIVNWLYVARGWSITNAWTDDMIEHAWRSSREYKIDGNAHLITAYCIKLTIHAYQGEGANVSDGEPANAP